MLNKTARFAKINLGKIGSDTTDTIIRKALGNVDVRYNGELYTADGDLLGIGDATETLSLAKTSITLSLSAVNLTLAAQIDSYRYQQSPVQVWIGKREDDGSVSNVHQVFEGVCDRHSSDNQSIKLVGESVWSTFEQPVGARTTSSEQASFIARELYGVSKTTVDTGFDYADDSFTGLTLGKSPSYRVSTTEVGRQRNNPAAPTNNRPTFEQIPGLPGSSLSDPGDAYRRPVVYGEGKIEGKLIYAINPTVSAVETAYGTNWSDTPNGVTNSTKYALLVEAVSEGEVSDIDVVFKGSAAADIVLNFTGEGKKYVLDASGNKLAAVEVKFGTDDQTALQSVIDLDGTNKWTSTSRCLGTVIVSVTCIASELWADGFPSYFYRVKGKKVKTVSSTGVLSTNKTEDTTFNPAWAILDLLLSPLYGAGLTSDQIDLQSFYDGSVIYSNRQYSGSLHPTITRGVLTNGQSLKASLDSLLAPVRSNLPFSNGKVRLNVNHYLNATELSTVASNHFDENNILGKVGSFNFSGANKSLNTVTVNTPVLGRSISSTYSHQLQDSSLLERDKGIVSEKTIFANFNSTELLSDSTLTPASLESSREYARSVLRSSNFFVTGSIVVDYWTNKDIRAGSVISLSSKRKNLVKAPFKVGTVTFMKQGMLKLDLFEFNQIIYDASDTNITDYRRTTVPDESFSKPTNFSTAGTAGTAGTNGFNNATVSVYKRSATQPTDSPTDVGDYTFSTAVLLFGSNTVSNGWQTELDATTGTEQLWIRQASAVSRSATDTIATNEWSGAVQAGSTGVDGDDGLSSGTAIYYQRTSSSTAPTVLPTSSATFNLGTGAVTPATNGNWQTLSTISSTGRYLWFTSATASSVSATDVIATTEWSTPVLLTEDGVTAFTMVVSGNRIIKNRTGSTTLTVTVYGGGTALSDTIHNNDLTYQWKKDGVNVSGATSRSITVNASEVAYDTTGTDYSCNVIRTI